MSWKAQLSSENSSFNVTMSKDKRRVSIIDDGIIASSVEIAANPILGPIRSGSRLSFNVSSRDNSSNGVVVRQRQLNKCEVDFRVNRRYCVLLTVITAAVVVIANTTLTLILNSQAMALFEANQVDVAAAKQIYSGQLGFDALGIWSNVSPSATQMLISSFNDMGAKLQAGLADIWTEIDNSHSDEYEDLWLNTPIITWELLDGEIRHQKRTLVNALIKLVDAVRHI